MPHPYSIHHLIYRPASLSIYASSLSLNAPLFFSLGSLPCFFIDRVLASDVFYCWQWNGYACLGGFPPYVTGAQITTLVNSCPVACSDVSC